MKSTTSALATVAALRKTTCVAMIAFTSLFGVTAFGKSEVSDRKPLTVAELKAIYLDCDRRAMRGVLGAGEAGVCSVAYEELKKRAFDGDFDKFLAWSRTQSNVKGAAR
jgi:hypothetical protein